MPPQTKQSAEQETIGTTPYVSNLILPPKSVWKNNFAYICLLCLFWLVKEWKGQAIWNHMLMNYSRNTLVYLFPFIISNGLYWIFSLAMCIFDYYQLQSQLMVPSHLPLQSPHPPLLHNASLAPQRKLQKRKEKGEAFWADFRKASIQVLFNQVVVGIPAGYLFMYMWNGVSGRVFADDLPTCKEMIWNVILLLASVEVGFYYLHRFFHWSRIYKYIHKRHHEFTSPIAVAAVYAHPIEHVVVNMFPVFLGPLIARSHLVTVLLWLALANLNTVNAHSGYTISGLPSSLDHDYHHYRYNNNYGVLGLLDTLHGTNKAFKEFVASARTKQNKNKQKT